MCLDFDIRLQYSSITDEDFVLTPSLPQPVKFPGRKMDGRVRKQYIFRSYNVSTFNAMRFNENPFPCQCEKENKKT